MLDRILIIDDATDAERLIHFCKHLKFPDVIVESYDPECGLPEHDFNWSRYGLILLDYDLGLEGQNGLHWLRQLKQQPNTPPIIFFTGYDSKQLEAKVHKLGADDFLSKDHITPELFSERVKKVLASSRAGAADDEADKDEAERTRVLSPQEKHLAMQLAGTAKADEHERTVLLSSEEMSEITSRRQQSKQDSSGQQKAKKTQHKAAKARQRVRKTQRKAGKVQQRAEATDKVLASSTPSRLISKRRPISKAGAGSVTRRPCTAKDIPIEVPGYRLEKKIGEGGMASIYLAEREEDQLKVVLKVLSLGEQGGSGLLRRFMREYKIIGQIDHPNVVQIHERAFASDFAYIAMEYFSHGDLAERLKAGIDGKTAISYLHQIAEGLGAAHALGIVHRDMKPANILFRSADELAVTDFGIAKDLEAENQIKQGLTMDGQLMGTLYYISPEQIEGGKADQRSDIYSLGIIMYKMLTNKHPYTGGTPMSVFERHLSAPIPKLPEQFLSLQPLLDGLLCKDPDERFQSTEDLLMGLNWKEWA